MNVKKGIIILSLKTGGHYYDERIYAQWTQVRKKGIYPY